MRLTVKSGTAILETKATPAVMSFIGRLEGRRRWVKEGGLVFEPSRYNIAVVCTNLPNVELIEETQEDYSAFDVAPQAIRYEARSDMPHQERGKAQARLQRHFAIFSEQGTGKTKVAIDLAGERFAARKVSGVIVISVKGVHRQWIDDQIPKWCGVPFYGAAHPLRSWDDKLLPEPDRLKWLTINIDGIKTGTGKATIDRFAQAHAGKLMVILDECHKIKDDTSERWAAANQLGLRAAFRLMLSGTPIARNLCEEWAQLKWLDPNIVGIRYRKSFQNEFCIMGGFQQKEVIGTKNLDRFKELVAPYTFRATKGEIGILPKAYSKWTFDLSPMQSRMIREMKRDLVARIDGGEIATSANFAVAAMKLQQIANGFVVHENEDNKRVITHLFEPKDNPRIRAMLEYIDATPGKIAIWCRFIADIKNIRAVLGDEAVYYFGETKEMDRRRAVISFLAPAGGARFFVSNPSAGGTGLNLQGQCQNALYYSNSDNSIDRWQSEDRIHRIGTNGAVVYTDLIAKGSSDRRIVTNLQKKRDFSAMALGEIRDWLTGEDDSIEMFEEMQR